MGMGGWEEGGDGAGGVWGSWAGAWWNNTHLLSLLKFASAHRSLGEKVAGAPGQK
jgi:hypothetical protein